MFLYAYSNRVTSYTLSETHTLYLRLAPVVTSTYICRSRSAMTNEEIKTTSIILTTQS
jgi:hypothetical protein